MKLNKKTSVQKYREESTAVFNQIFENLTRKSRHKTTTTKKTLTTQIYP